MNATTPPQPTAPAAAIPAPEASASDLTITSARHWIVKVPLKNPIVWGSGVRTGVTRLVVELETAGGIVGWGETICLLDAIPAVLDRVVIPLAIGRGVDQPRRSTATCSAPATTTTSARR